MMEHLSGGRERDLVAAIKQLPTHVYVIARRGVNRVETAYSLER
jgi:hypothetical protein